ncbi:GNAT superfamily N-acetyltransferase [Paenibacillus endophyticus]|uniref:GNAT superfamily N-acetyltransferase n=1 Tax=Paenibacillus endophyticus TaxID=1294268 RepID=A0A7W5C5R6_9BACL|nr:GNAT family N-acetyltransferase [Paenibacillus endophyticus]MBB3151611.1 GNAT superfamily N-acetyltransferase [Paenibacillus endophyticus]
MNELELRLISREELDEAITLERRCYSPEAAASLEGFQFRFDHYLAFFWTAWLGNRLVGMTNGIRTGKSSCGDEMKGDQADERDGRNFCVLTVAVDENQRRQGIGAKLLRKLIEQCEVQHIEKVILMCEEHLIPFYMAEQFELKGVSASTHGGITWYEMSRELHKLKHLTE